MESTEAEAEQCPPSAALPTPSATEQCDIMRPILRPSLKAGTWWYLLTANWFGQWKKYVGLDTHCHSALESDSPGPIDLSSLFGNDGDLRENMVDELDYSLVPSDVWEKLATWYGLMKDQEPIKRCVVEHGMFVKHCRVEVYLLRLKLKCHGRDDLKLIWKSFSRSNTVQCLLDTMKEEFSIDPDTDCRVWNQTTPSLNDELAKMTESLMDTGMYEDQLVVVEARNADGSWPMGDRTSRGSSLTTSTYPSTYTTSSSTSSAVSKYDTGPASSTSIASNLATTTDSSSKGFFRSSWFGSSQTQAPEPGLCGLNNLGNTCFMNSALQCLSNTAPLTEYFRKGRHEKELNRDNPLGMKGLIATAYGDLLDEMWGGRSSSTAPRSFKHNVGKFAPQFSGFAQHDSQELLAFLMDGLHEDLNRIKKKPYIEVRDSNGRPDEVVAKEAWENHQKRNNSIIVDTFQGQFKSTLVCPNCQQVSVIFDPFMFLQLPLPVNKKRSMMVELVRKDLSITPIMVRVSVAKSGSVSSLLAEVGKLCNVRADHLVLADVYGLRFHKVFRGAATVSGILDRDNIVAYELCCPVSETSVNGTMAMVHLYSRREKRTTYGGAVFSSSATTVSSMELFSQPQVMCVPRNDTTFDSLYASITDHLRPLITASAPDAASKATLLHLSNSASASAIANDENSNLASSNNDHGDSNLASEEDARPDRCDDMSEQSNVTAEAESSPEAESPPEADLFSLSFVNSAGTMTLSSLPRSAPVRLTAENYIGLNWQDEARCDVELASKTIKHSSCEYLARETPKTIHLQDCLELFLTEEQLGENDPWYCPGCKEHRRAFKKFDLYKMPDVLVIQLKRFSYNAFWRDKIDQLVDFPIEDLDLSAHCKQSECGVYDLHAVSNHYGGMGGGHYTAYAKNKGTGEWYHFDDSSVKKVSSGSVVSRAAYVLFYTRRSGKDEPSAKVAANGTSSL